MHQRLHHVRAPSQYSTCFRQARSSPLHVSGRAQAGISAAAPSRSVDGIEALSGDGNQAGLRASLTTVGGNGGPSYGHVAEASDKRANNSSAVHTASHSSAALFRPYCRDITVFSTKEDSWQVHRKVYPEFYWQDMQQIISSKRGLGLCALDKPNWIITRLDDLCDGGVYALWSTDVNERLVEKLTADIQNKRPIEHYFLEQRTQDFIREQARKLNSTATVRMISGVVKDEEGVKKMLKIDALAVVEDTLLLGVSASCVSLSALQRAAHDIYMLWLMTKKGEKGIYWMLNGLSHVKRCQVFLVCDGLADGTAPEDLAEVLEEARNLKVGVVLREGDDLSIAVEAPCMPYSKDLDRGSARNRKQQPQGAAMHSDLLRL